MPIVGGFGAAAVLLVLLTVVDTVLRGRGRAFAFRNLALDVRTHFCPQGIEARMYLGIKGVQGGCEAHKPLGVERGSH
jgi:hypothetical protein